MAFNAWPRRGYILSEDCVYPGDDDYEGDNPWPGEDDNWQEAVARLQEEIDALSDTVDDITVPQMATRADMSDWTSGKTLDAGAALSVVYSLGDDISDKAETADLADVAFSGDYINLSNRPIIPTAVSELTNDSGYQTAAQVTAAINAALAQIPFAETEVF